MPMYLQHDVGTYFQNRMSSAIVNAKVISVFFWPAGLLHFNVVGQQFADSGSKSPQVGYDRIVISMEEKSNQSKQISCKHIHVVQ